MGHVFETEVRTWDAHRDELLREHEGKFVLIKGEQVCGIFDGEMDAISAGWEQFGQVPILVKQIVAVEEPMTFGGGLLTVAN